MLEADSARRPRPVHRCSTCCAGPGRAAVGVAAALLAPALAGDQARRDELVRALAIRLADGSATEFTVWRLDGTVVYADEPAVIGRRFDPSPGVRSAIEEGRVSSGIDDLADPLRKGGTDVAVEISPLPPVSPETAAAVYRVVARETLVNVAKHARADHVRIELGGIDSGGVPVLRLSVVDDGVGIDGANLDDGHFGGRMLADRVADLGGRFTLDPAPGTGTAAVAVVPTPPAT